MKSREEIRDRADALLDLRLIHRANQDVFGVDEVDSELKVLSWVLGKKS